MSSQKSDKPKRGRRTKYQPDTHPTIAKNFALLGLTNEQIAKKMGINKDTLQRWIKRYEEFSDSIKEGKEEADFKVVAAQYQIACGYHTTEVKTISNKKGKIIQQINTSKHIAPNQRAGEFWLINRQPEHWTRTNKIVITDEQENPFSNFQWDSEEGIEVSQDE